MSLEISVEERHLHGILADLSRRRSNILEIQSRGNYKIVNAKTPLAELMGYSTAIRTLSSGTGAFSIELANYEVMTQLEQHKAYEKVTGFKYQGS